eukprot:1340858-Pleurochrysis_carterae.AAC.1
MACRRGGKGVDDDTVRSEQGKGAEKSGSSLEGCTRGAERTQSVEAKAKGSSRCVGSRRHKCV